MGKGVRVLVERGILSVTETGAGWFHAPSPVSSNEGMDGTSSVIEEACKPTASLTREGSMILSSGLSTGKRSVPSPARCPSGKGTFGTFFFRNNQPIVFIIKGKAFKYFV